MCAGYETSVIKRGHFATVRLDFQHLHDGDEHYYFYLFCSTLYYSLPKTPLDSPKKKARLSGLLNYYVSSLSRAKIPREDLKPMRQLNVTHIHLVMHSFANNNGRHDTIKIKMSTLVENRTKPTASWINFSLHYSVLTQDQNGLQTKTD